MRGYDNIFAEHWGFHVGGETDCGVLNERTGYWIQFRTNSISILNNIVNALKMVYLEPEHYFYACWGTFNVLVLNYLNREISNVR